ncbi:MAG: HEAT repeat domain-containing protein [Clostridium sp.]
MNNVERKLITELNFNKITQNEFIKKFPVDIKNNPMYIKELLFTAYDEKNADDVFFLLELAYEFDLIKENYVDILCELLDSKWNYSHEDIARRLQELKSEKAIEVLYKTALTKFEYLKHDNSYSLARKCMWALGDIGTDKAIEKLKLLANSEDEELREYAIEQFNRDKIKKNYNLNA